ncbi:adenylate/guanylate cyclase domain-containing protein [Sphingomonas sp.]|uniref:CHASE2 domain-containing protein n=1 Tax=Sphingomonas sp. TaxID=28214 RepID=UPI001B134917|nr:adenylate/guanylate cyclase domain-containing protein [Sphingomonas sp.]MBO9713235.1 adenylate/guanylate cyclase domain-containing protein [Sphingomonas sp.]
MVVEGGWKRFWRRTGLSVPGLILLVALMAAQLSGGFGLQRLGNLLFDSYQRAAPRPYDPDGPARIVDIDDETIKRLGQWPWPRSDVAELTKRLTDAGASAIAFDIVFSDRDRTAPELLARRAERDGASPQSLAALKTIPDPDAVFAGTIRQSPVVLGYFLGHDASTTPVEPKAGYAVIGTPPTGKIEKYTSSIEALPQFRSAATGLGFISLPPDSDAIIRRVPTIAMQDDQILPSLSVEALRVAQGAGSVIVKSSDGSGEIEQGDATDNSTAAADPLVASVKVGEFEIPTAASGELWMYYTAPTLKRVTPAWQILEGKLSPQEMEKRFGGRIVFIGASAQGLYDLRSTPVQGREMGVAIHAQAIEQMVSHVFLTRPYWGPPLENGLMLAAGLLMALLLPWMGAARGALLGLLMVGGMFLGSWLAFRQQHYLLDPVVPALALAAIWIVGTVYTFYREERQRAYIHHAFDRYLSPDLVKRIVDDPSRLELGGEEREMTVLFCDIRQFSRTSEQLSPQEIIRFLIAFLTPMCDILLARHATIDKFIGDAILAFWNAPLDDPDQYSNAARGALEMVGKLRELNRTMPGGPEPWPGEIAIGIGMNSGPCCVGNMGSAQRLSYSLIGDTVNLASRIEGLTKYYGAPIAMGEDLQVHLREFATVPLDHVRVVGRESPEVIHALLGDERLAAQQGFRAFATGHEAMGRAYRAQAWDEAEGLLDEHQSYAESLGLAKLYALMRERIERYRANPPGAEWDGVFGATEK